MTLFQVVQTENWSARSAEAGNAKQNTRAVTCIFPHQVFRPPSALKQEEMIRKPVLAESLRLQSELSNDLTQRLDFFHTTIQLLLKTSNKLV